MKTYPLPQAEYLVRPLPLIRTKPKAVLDVVFLAHKWVGIETHYFGGHTIRHKERECKACDRNVPRIWKGFIPVHLSSDSNRRGLLQFTPRVVTALLDGASDGGSVLGMRSLFSRTGDRVNSPLKCLVIGWLEPSEVYSQERCESLVRAIFNERAWDKSEEDI